MTKEKLIKTLRDAHVDFSDWGKDGTTLTIENLLQEIAQGEATLTFPHDTLTRTIHIVKMKFIRSDGSILVEDHQEDSHGKIFYHNHNKIPGGKIKPEEDPHTSLVREIEEELGWKIEKDYQIVATEKYLEETSQGSYPTLFTIRHVHLYTLAVSHHLTTEEFFYHNEDGTKLFFRWVAAPHAFI